MNKKVDSWVGCYPSNWKGLITDESFAHPAKYSNKLIRRIYEHMFSEGWLEPGMTVVDPFGGVALGAFDACRLGLNWRGVELEPRFVWWGSDNIRLWNKKFSVMPGWSTDAILLRGDSRFLAQVLSEAQGCVSSPPYAETDLHFGKVNQESWADGRARDVGPSGKAAGYSGAVSSPPYADGSQHTGGDDKHPERMDGGEYFGVGLNGVVSSPPYADSINSENGIDTTKIRGKDKHVGKNSQANQLTRYGLESAQLGAMKATDKGFDAAVGSPPFQGNSGGTNVTAKSGVLADGRLLKRHAAGNSEAGYGESEGNLGSLTPSESGFNAAISSPPYEGTVLSGGGGIANEVRKTYREGKNYGDENANLGHDVGNDFWLSARTIIEQVYMVLEPGAHAVWVVKNYVKNKQIIPFCEQWQQMCEAVGFVTLHEHHAMLVQGSPKIDFETVLCMEKPNEVA